MRLAAPVVNMPADLRSIADDNRTDRRGITVHGQHIQDGRFLASLLNISMTQVCRPLTPGTPSVTVIVSPAWCRSYPPRRWATVPNGPHGLGSTPQPRSSRSRRSRWPIRWRAQVGARNAWTVTVSDCPFFSFNRSAT